MVIKVANDGLGTIYLEIWRRGEDRCKKASIQLKSANRRPPCYGIPNPDLWTSTGLPVSIAFEDVFLRATKSEKERDLEITHDMLVLAATRASDMRQELKKAISTAREQQGRVEKEEKKKLRDQARSQRLKCRQKRKKRQEQEHRLSRARDGHEEWEQTQAAYHGSL